MKKKPEGQWTCKWKNEEYTFPDDKTPNAWARFWTSLVYGFTWIRNY